MSGLIQWRTIDRYCTEVILIDVVEKTCTSINFHPLGASCHKHA